jgi:hypothetical protein
MFYVAFIAFLIYLMRDDIYSYYWSRKSREAQEIEYHRLQKKYADEGYL